jgi:hypothetical protein
MPTDAGQYILDTDSSDFALGAVLSQLQNNSDRVIAFASRHLCPREQNYCAMRRELLAVVFYLKHFRHYLLGASLPVKVRTDHAALQSLRRIPEPVGHQARRLETMDEYNLTIEHRPGRMHGIADAMSRNPCFNRRCCPQYEQASCAIFLAYLSNASDGFHWAEGDVVGRAADARRGRRTATAQRVSSVDTIWAEGSETKRTADGIASVNRAGDGDAMQANAGGIVPPRDSHVNATTAHRRQSSPTANAGEGRQLEMQAEMIFRWGHAILFPRSCKTINSQLNSSALIPASPR